MGYLRSYYDQGNAGACGASTYKAGNWKNFMAAGSRDWRNSATWSIIEGVLLACCESRFTGSPLYLVALRTMIASILEENIPGGFIRNSVYDREEFCASSRPVYRRKQFGRFHSQFQLHRNQDSLFGHTHGGGAVLLYTIIELLLTKWSTE